MRNMYQTPPVVLDTNVLVAGACRREGSRAHQILMAVLRGDVPLVLTVGVALEYQEVLQRPGVLALTGLTHEQAVDLVSDLIAQSRPVQTAFMWRPNLRDETDNKFVEAAIHGAAIIVTYNEADYRRPDLMQHGWAVMSPHDFCLRYLG